MTTKSSDSMLLTKNDKLDHKAFRSFSLHPPFTPNKPVALKNERRKEKNSG